MANYHPEKISPCVASQEKDPNSTLAAPFLLNADHFTPLSNGTIVNAGLVTVIKAIMVGLGCGKWAL